MKNKELSKELNNGVRETIESIVVAFILAFLFRTFLAEAFVIPTGSMAPTLRGRHKEVTCDQCQFHFSIGASDELDSNSGRLAPEHRIEKAICPNCRFKMSVRDAAVYKGDRILVNKFPYEFGSPSRWDVLVFKFPEDPVTNYIKRLIGLPGEKLYIIQGDVYREMKDRQLQILRKDDPNKQRELQILVHHNDYPARELIARGWARRWAAVERVDLKNPAARKTKMSAQQPVAGWAESKRGWTLDDKNNAFELTTSTTTDGKHRWVRYRHFVPQESNWRAVANKTKMKNLRPQLITDFCGYNAYEGGHMGRTPDLGQYWTGDLTINCEVDIKEIGSAGELILELNEGARKYRCQFDLATGTATLMHNVTENIAEDEWVTIASAETPVTEEETYQLSFANVDHRLCLWVNDRLIDFGKDDNGKEKTRYQSYDIRGYTNPTVADLIPVGIAAKNVSMKISHLVLQRDIYYRGERKDNDGENAKFEYGGDRQSSDPASQPQLPKKLQALVYEPELWWEEYAKHKSPAIFERLDDDEFFVMGDNSPRSQDSRLWKNDRKAKHRHAVPRANLVGKAFFIYWPHGIPFMNDGQGYTITNHKTVKKIGDKNRQQNQDNEKQKEYPNFRFPFYPDISRMRRIR